MNPTFKRWLICILLLIVLLGLAHTHAGDATSAPESSSAKVEIPTQAVSKPAEFSVKKTAIESQFKTGLKQAPARVVQVELRRCDVSEPIRLSRAKIGNTRGENSFKSPQKNAFESADERVWIFLCWPGARFPGE